MISCKEEGCDDAAKVRKMCRKHYYRWWRRNLAHACAIEGCEEPAISRGLCSACCYRAERDGTLPPPKESSWGGKAGRAGRNRAASEGIKQALRGAKKPLPKREMWQIVQDENPTVTLHVFTRMLRTLQATRAVRRTGAAGKTRYRLKKATR